MRTVKEQLARLSAASIRLGVVKDGHAITVNSQIVTRLRYLVSERRPAARFVAVDHPPFARLLGKPEGPCRTAR